MKTVKNWRKATEEELKSGSSEMILIDEITIDVADDPKEKIKLNSIDIDSMSEEDLIKLANRLKRI